VVVSVVAIVRESAEVARTQQLVPGIYKRAEKDLPLKQDSIVGVHKPFETIAFVIQLLMVKTLGPCQTRCFPSGRKPDIANWLNGERPGGEKTCFSLKSF